MKFNNINEKTSVPVDVHEWNENVQAFLKPLNTLEMLVFNDYFITFYDREKNAEERLKAGFNACVVGLVDDDGEQLIDESDFEQFKNASFVPVVRMFTAYIDDKNAALETAKKN